MTEAEVDAEIARLTQKTSGAPSPHSVAPTPVDNPPLDAEAAQHAALDKEIARYEGKVATNVTPALPKVIQEMHPDFTTADRLVVKNFANNPQDAASYLQNRHPNLEVKADKDGQYLARAKNSNEPYRVLDPDTNPFTAGIGENLRDLGDIGTDAAQGLLSGAATAAGGIAGGIAGLGVGSGPLALAGSAAAGGLSNAGLEALKQKIGVYLGVNKSVDGTGVGIAGGVGALSPLMFGTGAASGAITNAIEKAGITDAAGALSSVGLAQRGALGRLYDATPLSKVGSALSGATADTLRTLHDKWDRFHNVVNDPQGITNMLTSLGEGTKKGFKNAISAAGDTINGAYDSATDAGKQVDIRPLISRLKDAIGSAKDAAEAGGNTEGSGELHGHLQQLLNDHFTGTQTELVPKTSVVPSGYLDEIGNPTTKTLTEMVPQDVRKELTTLDPTASRQLERSLAGVADYGSLKTGTTGVASSRMAGSTPAEKGLMNLAGGLKHDLAESNAQAVGSAATAAKAKQAELLELQKEFNASFEKKQAASANLRNSDITANKWKQELMQRTEDATGYPVMDTAKMAQAYETFGPGRQSWFNVLKNKNQVPLALVGTGAGYYAGSEAGGGHGAGFAGGLLGGATGALLGSPLAMKTYIGTALKSDEVKNIALNKGPLAVKNYLIEHAPTGMKKALLDYLPQSINSNAVTQPLARPLVESAWQRMRTDK